MAISSLPTATVHQSNQALALPTYPPIYTSSQLFFTSDNDGQKYHLIEEFRTHSLPLLLQHNAHVRLTPPPPSPFWDFQPFFYQFFCGHFGNFWLIIR